MRKSSLVAGGCKIDPPVESCFAAVVGSDSVRLALFMGFLDKMLACAAEVEIPHYIASHMENMTSLQGQSEGIWKDTYN